ncbi:hypothetical protein Tco_0348676 [Tanacetum coccineum]
MALTISDDMSPDFHRLQFILDDLQHLHAILQELQYLKAILRELQKMQSACKHLLGKIAVLEATMKMYMHPEEHTLNSAALLHEVYNDMGKLGLE